MRKHITSITGNTRVLTAAAAVAVLGALAVTEVGCCGGGGSQVHQQWMTRYSGPGNDTDAAASVAVTGGRVFVTGASTGAASGYDYVTVAYDAATGGQLWASRYNGPGNGYDAATSVAVTGGRVFVTGQSDGGTSGQDYVTVAYDAATGAQLWASRYNGPGNGPYHRGDAATSVAVTGGTVFVTGQSDGSDQEDYATVAYDAATGAQLWASRYNGPGNSTDEATSVAVTGGTVFVTGTSRDGLASWRDYATVAYDAATGGQLWASRYNGPGNSTDEATSVAVTGGTVFVTGQSTGSTSNTDYATVAYSAATGGQLWASRYNGPGNSYDSANSVAVTGGTVFVTGQSTGSTSNTDYATVAYSAATGGQLWASRYNGPGNSYDSANSVAVTGGTVFVTGQSTGSTSGQDYATVAYSG